MTPTISELTQELMLLKSTLENEDGLEVRLQVLPDSWQLWTGDSQYDMDHRGHWGHGGLFYDTNCRALARDLIEQVRESIAEEESLRDDNP